MRWLPVPILPFICGTLVLVIAYSRMHSNCKWPQCLTWLWHAQDMQMQEMSSHMQSVCASFAEHPLYTYCLHKSGVTGQLP